MARITRKELKADKFALEVEHTVTLFEEHKREISFTAVLAAFSSAICLRRVRIESLCTRRAWAMLDPKRSAWIKMAARLRTSSTPVRTPRS